MLLALDTSTRLAGVALYDGDRGLLAEYNWQSANQHTVELMPQVAQMAARAGVMPADLRGVAVALGPGSFTGLRVALAAAKGLALAQGLPLLGVSTLDAVAYPHQWQPMPVVALIQAGRGRVCWAIYAHGPGGWSPQSEYRLTTVAALAAEAARPMMFVGELLPADQQTLIAQLGRPRASFLPAALTMRRAGYLAELAWKRFVAGEADDPATLSPIYLHEPPKPRGAGG
ncbi:MAG: tRNA (adenosine(37)-N6)-threonylcarbamoyltransferase complex dimerization subunit type 1 TsaB [Chloroflexi bacterium]|nr:tRNA (adenosine(37)-N6)-threonylcarbamoyltransferase complex dimerization subunit type 1 TsaB [Chloroflexota bacterium]